MTLPEQQHSNAEATAAPEFGREQGWKLLIELGPLLVLFLVNWIAGRVTKPEHAIFWGTGAFMLATVIALAASRLMFGHIAKMPLFTAALVGVFGGLTLWLQDDLFIKVKPTILFCLFAVLLLGGLMAGRLFLQTVFGTAMQLTDEGWRKLTWRWSAFFLVLAVLNELVWRNFSTDFWVSYKVFGVMPLMMIFAMIQVGLLKKYEKAAEN